MTMQDLLLIIGKVSFIVLIVMSVLFGITIAVQTFLSLSIKRILKNSRENFDKIADTNAKKECLKIIEQSKTEIVELLDINAKTKKLERKNKVKKAFNGKEKTIDVSALNAKDVFLDLFKCTASVFSYYGGRERGYLSFTEREIFSVIKLLRQRLEEIVDKLENGNLSLEEMMKLYEEGTALAAKCAKSLDAAQLKISELSSGKGAEI